MNIFIFCKTITACSVFLFMLKPYLPLKMVLQTWLKTRVI